MNCRDVYKRQLLAHVLKKTRIYLYTNFDQMLNRDELAAYHTLVEDVYKRQTLC